MQTWLSKSLVVTALALGAPQFAHAEQSDTVRWQSVIGIIQGGNAVGTGTGTAIGAPGPWSAQGGHVAVDLTRGKMQFDVRGLVFAAGNAIGNTGTVAVFDGAAYFAAPGSQANMSAITTPDDFSAIVIQGVPYPSAQRARAMAVPLGLRANGDHAPLLIATQNGIVALDAPGASTRDLAPAFTAVSIAATRGDLVWAIDASNLAQLSLVKYL